MSSSNGTCPGSYSGDKFQNQDALGQRLYEHTVLPYPLSDKRIMIKGSNSPQEKAGCRVLRIG